LIGLGIFDDEVLVEEKRLMMSALDEDGGLEEPLKRITPYLQPATKGLHDFITKSTKRFFNILKLRGEFLLHDPSEWGKHETYKRSRVIVRSVKLVNDLAERIVAFIQEFKSSITHNEEQKQFLLQVIEAYSRAFSVPTKTGAMKPVTMSPLRPINDLIPSCILQECDV